MHAFAQAVGAPSQGTASAQAHVTDPSCKRARPIRHTAHRRFHRGHVQYGYGAHAVAHARHHRQSRVRSQIHFVAQSLVAAGAEDVHGWGGQSEQGLEGPDANGHGRGALFRGSCQGPWGTSSRTGLHFRHSRGRRRLLLMDG